MPKVSVEICEKCSRLKKCTDYKLFKEPLLFPDINKEGLVSRKRKKRFSNPVTQTPSHEEQLTMGFLAGK